MPTIESIIDDYAPADGETSVPLKATISVLFDREMDEAFLTDEFFVEGPDTDTFVGPGFQFQTIPDNVSQGTDFLESPGLRGIVQGTITYKKIDMTDPDLEVGASPYRTKLIFTPTNPMGALTQYTAHIPAAKDLLAVEYTGHYTFSWTTGTGSIQALPTEISTSILSQAVQATVVESATPLLITKITPKDGAVQQPTNLKEIVIEFNKDLDAATAIDANVKVEALPMTSHPSANVIANGELAKSLTVSGKKLTIKI